MENTVAVPQEQIAKDADKQQYVVDTWDELVTAMKNRIKILEDELNVSNSDTPMIKEVASIHKLELARLKKDLIIETASLHHKRTGLKGLRDHQERQKKMFEEQCAETNSHFDELIATAKTKLHIKQVANALRMFETGKIEILKDQQSKNKFYADLKQMLK